jgi:hypothetical protein
VPKSTPQEISRSRRLTPVTMATALIDGVRLAALAAVPKARIVFVVSIALGAGLYSFALQIAQPASATDLGPLLYAARSFVAGQNPYEAVGRVAPWSNVPPVLYPLPAILLFTPVAALPLIVVSTAWSAVGAGLLAWVVTRDRVISPSSVVFFSVPFIHAVQLSQWTTLLTAAPLLPWGGFLLACKPTTSLWMFAYKPRWRTVLGAGVFTLVSLFLWPSWIPAWRGNFATAVNVMSPLILPGGIVIAVLSVLRWRRPEARLLGVMACVPHSTLPYELVPLFLIPKTWGEAGVLVAGTLLATVLWNAGMPYENAPALVAAFGARAIWCVYLPCAVMIMRRPNEWPGVCSSRGEGPRAGASKPAVEKSDGTGGTPTHPQAL